MLPLDGKLTPPSVCHSTILLGQLFLGNGVCGKSLIVELISPFPTRMDLILQVPGPMWLGISILIIPLATGEIIPGRLIDPLGQL